MTTKHKLLILFLFNALGVDAALAQNRQRIPLKLDQSVLSIEGDDTFVTARSTFSQLPKNHYRYEELQLNEGLIEFGELNPGYSYTYGGRWEESRDLATEWNRLGPIQKRGLKLSADEVRDARNRYGTYYYAVKGNEKGSCAFARQVFGNIHFGNGTKRLHLKTCWDVQRGSTSDLERFVNDVMARFLADDGAINKVKAAARTANPASELASTNGANVSFHWEGHTVTSGVMHMENDRGKGRLTVVIQGASNACEGFWALARGAYGTATEPEGTWTLSCPGGVSAGGVYKSSKPGQATGTGTDSTGKKITFSVGS